MTQFFLWMLLFCTTLFLTYLFFQWRNSRQQKIAMPHIEKVYSLPRLSYEVLSYRLITFFGLLSTISMVVFFVSSIVGINPFDRFFNAKHFTSFKPKSTTAFLFLIDCSGSMKQPFSPSNKSQKIEVVRTALQKGIEGANLNYTPLIGLDAFARISRTVIPMTYNREYIFSQIKKLDVQTQERLQGTATGYALLKGILQILSSRILEKNTSTPAIIPSRCILVTDGIEEPHPEDYQEPYRSMRMLQALELAHKNNIIVDYVLLGNAWKALSQDEQERIQNAIIKTKGSMYQIEGDERALSSAITSCLRAQDINVQYTIPHTNNRDMIYITLFGIGCILLIRGLFFLFEKEVWI